MATKGFRTYASNREPGVFEARYPGHCYLCDDHIDPGDTVRYDDDELVHNKCATAEKIITAPKVGAPVAVCPHCNIDHAGECF
jgi:hypothetical protein